MFCASFLTHFYNGYHSSGGALVAWSEVLDLNLLHAVLSHTISRNKRLGTRESDTVEADIYLVFHQSRFYSTIVVVRL